MPELAGGGEGHSRDHMKREAAVPVYQITRPAANVNRYRGEESAVAASHTGGITPCQIKYILQLFSSCLLSLWLELS